MRFLRRSRGSATVEPDTAVQVEPAVDERSGHNAGKGRPTPKRREAESRRRGPAPPPPRSQREAARRSREVRGSKEERREAAAQRRARMLAGDDRYLMPRDRGPARAYARDLVDARRNLMGLFMPLAVLVFLSVLLPIRLVQVYGSLVTLCFLAAMIVEGLMLGRFVSARVRERFPAEQVSGLSFGWYSFTRATQLRRFRVPKPRVSRGEQVA